MVQIFGVIFFDFVSLNVCSNLVGVIRRRIMGYNVLFTFLITSFEPKKEDVRRGGDSWILYQRVDEIFVLEVMDRDTDCLSSSIFILEFCSFTISLPFPISFSLSLIKFLSFSPFDFKGIRVFRIRIFFCLRSVVSVLRQSDIHFLSTGGILM